MKVNLEGLFEEEKESTQKVLQKETNLEKKQDQTSIQKDKWGLSKKNRKKYKKENPNIKKRINLLELDFTLQIKNEEESIDLKQFVKKIFDFKTILKKSTPIEEENDFGNVEYKLKLVDSSSERIQHLTTQMKFRLKEGSGEAFYRIGYEDNGNNLGLSEEEFLLTLSTLCFIARELKVELVLEEILEGIQGKVGFINVRKKIAEKIKLELKVMLLGPGKSGKSTLLGVILTDKFDDGQGRARIKILNHKHEVLTGITSSLTYTVIGFDQMGKVLNNKTILNSWESTVDGSYKIISFIDCGGSEKHHRKAFQGYLTCLPDFTVLVLSIKNTFSEIQAQLEMTMNLQCNFGIVVTHMDQASKSEENKFIKFLRDICFQYEDFIPLVVRNEEDAVYFAKCINESILPIFFVSNVNGANLNLFVKFLNIVPLQKNFFLNDSQKTEFIVQKKFQLENHIILTGWVYKGILRKNQKLFIGPFPNLKFYQVVAEEIQCYKISVRTASSGQTCSIKIRFLRNEKWDELMQNIKKGMVLAEAEDQKPPELTQEFWATINLCNTKQDIEVKGNYEPVLVSETFNQSCWLSKHFLKKTLKLEKNISKSQEKKQFSIENVENKKRSDSFRLLFDAFDKNLMDQEELILKANQENNVKIKFKFKPEYVKIDQKFVIYDQKVKATGIVKKIFKQFYLISLIQQNNSKKKY